LQASKWMRRSSHNFVVFFSLQTTPTVSEVLRSRTTSWSLPTTATRRMKMSNGRRSPSLRLISVGADHLLTTTVPRIFSWLLSDWNELLIGFQSLCSYLVEQIIIILYLYVTTSPVFITTFYWRLASKSLHVNQTSPDWFHFRDVTRSGY